MKSTFLPYAGTGTNRISCVKISREKRELHASPRHEIAGSLAKFIGIAIAKVSSMKTIIRILLAVLCLGAGFLQLHAQGTIIDQESYPTPINPVGNGNVDGLFINSEPATPLTQSFIPSLSAIDFVALEFEHGTGPATVEVNLWEGSPNVNSATLLGATTAVTMPSGFENNNLGVAGIETFYFSTLISLTPGDTYYLEPVGVSGGAQWAVVTIIGDTYPNGELNVNGSPFVNVTDMWFQEGILTVPEPATLALIGCAGLFAFMFKWRSKLPILVFACSLFTLSVLSVHATDSVVQATADAAGLTPVSGSTLPLTGTFWVTTVNPDGGLTTLPYPMLPTDLSDLPTYLVTNDIYIVDDTGGKISSSSTTMSTAEASSVVSSESQTIKDLIDEEIDPGFPIYASLDNVIDLQWNRLNKGCHLC